MHTKTAVVLGYLAWQMYRLDRLYDEWEYMSYTEDLAQHQLKRGKRIIKAIPFYFDRFKDATQAEGVWLFEKDKKQFFCEPAGILSFKRGKHPRGIVLDDVLKDPKAAMMNFAVLDDIKRTFNDEVQSMPMEELHVLGTPQDREDLFAEINNKPGFNCKIYPAWSNKAEGKVLWPERFPATRLREIEADIGERSFNKEFMCRPVRSQEGFFSDEDLDACIKARLKNRRLGKDVRLNEYAFGGLDIGKKRHPSHLSVFGKDRRGRLVQLLSLWMDGEDYKRQLDLCKLAIKSFRVQRLYYDDTRAELEGFREIGELPAEMKGLAFTEKLKYQMAVEFEKVVRDKAVMFINDTRQKQQILNVDNSLKSAETSGGHGDSFWSNALAIHAARGTGARISWL